MGDFYLSYDEATREEYGEGRNRRTSDYERVRSRMAAFPLTLVTILATTFVIGLASSGVQGCNKYFFNENTRESVKKAEHNSPREHEEGSLVKKHINE